MSAPSNGHKFRFGGFFKSLFGGTTTEEIPVAQGNGHTATATAYATPHASPAPARPAVQNYSGAGNGNGSGHTTVFNRRPASVSNHDHGTGRLIQISLQSIICLMPPDLRSRVRQAVPDGLSVTVSLEKILPQLAQGSVKVPFGDIRAASPQIFAASPDADSQLVPLPLGEILPHLKPSMLPRRQAQRHTEVSEDIVGPFASGGPGLAISNDKPGVPPPTAHTPIRVAPGNTPRRPISPSTPIQRVQPPQPVLPPRQSIRSVPPATLAPSAPIPMTPSMPASRPAAPAPEPMAPVAPAPQPVRMTPAAETTPPLAVPLASLIAGWPESVRHEIAQLNLDDAQIAIPTSQVESGLKRGRVAFPWTTLRSWIRPAPLPFISANDSTELELPLRIIAPLFVNRRNGGAAARQKVAVDETIPNLFFGFPQPETPAAPVISQPMEETVEAPVATEVETPAATAVDTNYFSWNENNGHSETTETEYRPQPAAHTDFKSRHATPQEIINRAAALEGVAGALIALPDGLKVASQIPSELNGDTLAAFLPQLFNKMSSCTRELRMGELNNLNFTVGNAPWKIFRVNAVFFAAFGRPGQPLPTAQLAALAALLDRKAK